MGDGLSEQGADVIVVNRIDHLAAIALADHEAEVAQHSQLLGDRRLLHTDLVSEVSHRAGTGRESAEDADPTWRRERLHRLRDRSCRLRRDKCEVRIAAVAHEHIRSLPWLMSTFSHEHALKCLGPDGWLW